MSEMRIQVERGQVMGAVSTTGRNVTKVRLNEPSLSVQAGGIGGGNTSQYFIEQAKFMTAVATDKPPYRIPSMEEIRAVAWNDLRVASFFAGCGGSSTGYRMAGFKIAYANEFDAHARECYAVNMDITTVLDGCDVRTVTAEEVLKATGLEKGQLDVLDGSPPCQTFSTAGKRRMSDPRSDLFFEYVRLLDGLKPKAFVAENVSGLVKGVAKGYFIEIMRRLKGCGYRVTCRVLDAQWLGVPQRRQRTIFVGVREDLELEPAHPSPLPYRYSVREACPWMDSKQNVIHDTGNFVRNLRITDCPCPTVPSSHIDSTHFLVVGRGEGDTKCGRKPDGVDRRKFTIAELKRICSFPDDFLLTGSYAKQWARLGNAVPPLMMKAIAETVRDILLKCNNG